MRKLFLGVVSVLICADATLSAATSYFRTPLSFIESRWGTVHYPLPWINDCDNWEIDTLGVLYERKACSAYGQHPDCKACPSTCSTNEPISRNTVSLSQLWFGRDSFLAEELFAGGELDGTSDNPFLRFTRITPQFGYDEKGVTLALNVVRKNLGCGKTGFVGFRVAMPITTIEVNQRSSGGVLELLEIDNDFANTMVTIQQQLNGQDTITGGSNSVREVKAYRLDLLTSLQLPDGTPMVQFGTNSGSTATDTRIAGQDITTNQDQYQSAAGSGLRAPMYVYKQSNGIFPLPAQGMNKNDAEFPRTVIGGSQIVYPMIDNEADALLSADGLTNVNGGAALTDGQFAAFGGANSVGSTTNLQQDYAGGLAGNLAAQRQLFLVPVAGSAASLTFENIGLLVQNTIEYVLASIDEGPDSIITFFAERGIDLEASDCSTGAGDTFVQLYAGRMCDCWFADGLLGFRFPTGTNYDTPKRIYQQTTGNNGHFAIKLGVEGGYKACDWLGIKADFFWEHNFSAREKRAAAFVGSTTRNIGPCIDARVSWDAFQAHVDATFFNPRCCDMGWDFGYELYAKLKDKVSFCGVQTLDFSGQMERLDPNLLRNNTNTQSHKVRGEVFKRWDCFEIFLGGSYIIAGRQVMKEAEGHIGFKAYY